MVQILAIIGFATLFYLAWRAFGPQHSGQSRGMGPDDDPEFLRGLNPHPNAPDGKEPHSPDQ